MKDDAHINVIFVCRALRLERLDILV